MISTIKRARSVQARRQAAGKKGIAAAVRRFLRRTGYTAKDLGK
ncbi:hypothetical protein [Lysobacter sp. Root667]|nr:hypothetical protein [Lysobacter sp. Root667]